MGARIVMGGAFLVFGLNGFAHFLPTPEPPPKAAAFATALVSTGYMIPLIVGTQVFSGALLLGGVTVPLALVLIAPVLVNILCFHLFLDPAGIGPGLVLAVCWVILVRAHWSKLRALLGKQLPPTGGG